MNTPERSEAQDELELVGLLLTALMGGPNRSRREMIEALTRIKTRVTRIRRTLIPTVKVCRPVSTQTEDVTTQELIAELDDMMDWDLADPEIFTLL